MTAVRETFAVPPSAYRPAPLWAWNDEMTAEQIRFQLGEMHKMGFGGAFVNPRPGLVNEYLSDEWFELWGEALAEAERLGMQLSIYDENSYPSGFAGGHVPSELPDCLANCVVMRRLSKAELATAFPAASVMLNRPGHPIRIFAVGQSEEEGCESSVVRDVTDLPAAQRDEARDNFLVFELGMPETNAWLGGFAYADLLRPEVTQLFHETTYEAYRKRFGDKFGGSVPAVFTDEPEISPGNLFRQNGSDVLPFSYWFAGQFRERNGYDLKDYLPCLFVDVGEGSFDRDPKKVRFDYYETMHELWVENFFRPISDWCVQHGIAWTGHFVEHNWPFPWGRSSPSVMSLYEYMQWPGIDILRTNSMRQPGHEGTEMLTLVIREAASVANQLGKERVLCEAYGAGGWDSEFNDYKRIADWLFVHGINYLVPHMVLASIAGARKRDHPQSFDWRQPWKEEFAELSGYFARVSYLLSQGKTLNPILLLNPTQSCYMETPGSQEGELRVNVAPKRPDMSRFLETAQQLCDGQWNYDLGDEYIMERHGSVAGGSLHVGACAYNVIIVPNSMRTIRRSTFRLLASALDAGVLVLALGEPPERIDGEIAPEAKRLASHPRWVQANSFDALQECLGMAVKRRVEWGEPDNVPSGVHHLWRELDDGSAVCLITNSSLHELRQSVRLVGCHAEVWNPWTGAVEPCAYRLAGGGKLETEVRIWPEGSVVLRVYAEAFHQPVGHAKEASPVTRNGKSKQEIIPLSKPITVKPERDNVLVIDYCDLTIGGKTYKGLHFLRAQQLVYEHHGFEANPWDNAVQFKRRLLDRNRFSDTSGFTVMYRFRLRDHPAVAKLLVERGNAYRLRVNGHPVEWSDNVPDLDRHFREANIAALLKYGDNTIELTAQPFDLLLELEAVCIEGPFAVLPDEEGHWAIHQPRTLRGGSWKDQGYPFYGHAVVYEMAFEIDEVIGKKRYVVMLPDWSGVSASLSVNGSHAGLFGVGNGSELEIGTFLRKGENVAQIRVCGSLKNLFGPFYHLDRPRRTVWPSFWKQATVEGLSVPERYDQIDYGLMGKPVLK